MSRTTVQNGRLCNQIIRNLSLSLLAKKYDLYVEYSNFKKINDILGIKLHCGNKKFSTMKDVKVEEYMIYLNSDIDVQYNLNFMKHYYQTEEITTFLYNHLNKNKTDVINKNPFKSRYNNNNDLFLHIRVDDAKKWNVGIDYYLRCIEKVEYDSIYIGSDNLNDDIVMKLKSKYPNIFLLTLNDVETIQFGSTCKSIILSHGTFSAVIGYLGFYSSVYYPNVKPGWCPLDLFMNKGWNPFI